ncbi:MAG: toll/interleukin-1 receptor domain-containing protein [Pseudomonadota bacterium]
MSSGDQPSDGGYRYRAFISYSHADLKAAQALHRRLESYRFPRNTAVTTGDVYGSLPGRLGPIFRDEGDLAAAHDLSEAVRTALGQSRFLLVLCSPDAVRSQWVSKEIELFRELNPGGEIFAMVVRGAPETAFPAPLLDDGREPLAADLRPGHDGSKLGFLKVAAALGGVPLDQLVQRDARRRVRQMTTVAAAAVAMTLVVAFLALSAQRAQREAEVQRANAESLIEFMLTDLRGRLRADGKLATMSAVSTRALDYYGNQQQLAELSDDSLKRRARVLHALGEDDEMRHAGAAARAKFEEAARTTEAILARNAESQDAILAHAHSEYWLGLNSLNGNDVPSAKTRFERYADLTRKLLAQDSTKALHQMEAGHAAGNLCVIEQRLDNSAAAADRCADAVGYKRAALAARPDNKEYALELANQLAWLADAERDAGDMAGARRSRDEQENLLRRWRTLEPDNFDLLDMWITAQAAQASLEIADEDYPAARTRLDDAAKQADRLTAEDPQNRVWQTRQRLIAEQYDALYAASGRGAGRIAATN